MTPGQIKFVECFLKSRNATRAYMEAGYSASPRAANRKASRLMRHPDVRRLIDNALADREKAIRLEGVAMLEDISAEARDDLARARVSIQEAGRTLREAIAGIHDIHRLSAPAGPKPDGAAASQSAVRSPTDIKAPPRPEAPAEYQPIISWPETLAFALQDYNPLND